MRRARSGPCELPSMPKDKPRSNTKKTAQRLLRCKRLLHFPTSGRLPRSTTCLQCGASGCCEVKPPRSCRLRPHTDTHRKTVAHRAQFRNGNGLRSFRCNPIHACRQSRRNGRCWPTLCRLWGHFCPSTRWRRNGRRSTSGCVDGLRRFPEVCCGAGFRLSHHVASKGGWNLARVKILRERGAFPKEQCDAI